MASTSCMYIAAPPFAFCVRLSFGAQDPDEADKVDSYSYGVVGIAYSPAGDIRFLK